MELLKEKGMEGVQVFVGGIIPAQDIPELKSMGVAEVFLPGASTLDVVRLDPAPSPPTEPAPRRRFGGRSPIIN